MSEVNFDSKVAVSRADKVLFSKLKVFYTTLLLKGSTRTGMRYSSKSPVLSIFVQDADCQDSMVTMVTVSLRPYQQNTMNIDISI